MDPRETQGRSTRSAGRDVQSGLRGSSMLLVGRVVAIGLNFLVQVLMVRFLAREDYGSFSFVLSLTALAANLNLLGLARAMSRFGPLYGEREDPKDLLGSIVVSLGLVSVLGFTLVALALVWNGQWQGWFTDNVLSRELLVLMVALIPLTAIDAILEVLAATFAGARAIFLRRHLMTPLLRLGAVILVMVLGRGPRALAVCYLVAAAIGVGAYGLVLYRALGPRLRERPLRLALPYREVLGYGASMLLVDVASVFTLHLPAVVLEVARGSSAVAGLRAVAPLATLTLVVFQSFKLLYVPLATRSFERGGREALTGAFWSATRWVALLTFPVFAVCVFLSPLAVVRLFGEQYRDAVQLASIMGVGYYLHAILGVNTLTLQALGEGRRLRSTAVVGILAAILANAILIPLFGALGAAVATTATLLATDLTNATKVALGGRVGPPPAGLLRLVLIVGGTSLCLGVAIFGLEPSAAASIAMVGLGIGFVWVTTKASLDLLGTFPELARLPLLRWILT